MKRILFLLLFLIVGGLIYISFADYNHKHELIFFNGDVLTMKDSTDLPEAVFVKDGKILAVGTKAEVFKLKTEATQLIDLQGKTLMPGFFDAHGHMDLAAVFYSMTDVSGINYRNEKEVLNRIETAAKQAKPNEWVYCYGLDPILTKGIRTPTLAYMDSIAPKNPLVIITKALHVWYVNSKAFAELGITAQTPDPSKASYYERDANHQLTGAIIEQEALEPLRKKIQETVLKNFVPNTEAILHDYAKLGVTSAINMGIKTADNKILSLYEHLAASSPKPLLNIAAFFGKLPKRKANPRVFLYLPKENINFLPETKPANQDDFYRIAGVKFWYDGSPYSGSMLLKKPYIRSNFTINGINLSPNHTGESLIKESELEEWIRKIQEKGFPVAIHAQGDIANEEVINVFQKLHHKKPINSFRHRIEHGMLLPKNSVESIRNMGISPSFHINHILYYGNFLGKEILGEERASLIFPIQTVASQHIPYSLHADMPQFIPNPLLLASTSVNRTTEEGTVINAAERVSVWNALKSITINAAWQLHMEDKLGSIEKGKYADFVILDKNPLKVPRETLGKIQVKTTMVAGNIIWQRE